MAKLKIDVSKHILVPKHAKLSEKERKELFGQYNLSPDQLPKIARNDSAIINIDVKSGDIIKITRNSPTSGEMFFYRVVVDG